MPEQKFEPIDTSRLRGTDWCFVVGWLTSSIVTNGKATREDAEEAIRKALVNRELGEK